MENETLYLRLKVAKQKDGSVAAKQVTKRPNQKFIYLQSYNMQGLSYAARLQSQVIVNFIVTFFAV